MGFGLRLSNPSGELVISSDTLTYGYVGKAALVSTTPPGTLLANSVAGYSTYTISFPGKILVAVKPSTSGTCALLGKSLSGGVWTIYVHNGNGTLNSAGYENETPTEVFVFGVPVSSAGGFGFELFTASGALAANLLNRPVPIAGRIVMAANVASAALPAVTKPVVIGMPSDISTNNTVNAPRWNNQYSGRGWRIVGGNLQRQPYLMYRTLEDASAGAVLNIYPVTALVVEAGALT